MSSVQLPKYKISEDPKKKNMSERQIHKILEEFDLSEGTSMQDSTSYAARDEPKA